MTSPDLSDLLSRAKSLSHGRVLCIGDIMLDNFVYGDVNRISPEGPIPVIKITRTKQMLGGVGNVAANLCAIGVQTGLIALTGNDSEGKIIQKALQDCGCHDVSLVTGHNRPTTIKSRYISANQQLLRTDVEDDSPVSADITAQILQKLKQIIQNYDAVILSDYGKGLLTPDLCAGIIKTAQAANRPVITDPKGRDYTKYRGARLITPNLKELSEAAGHSIHNDTEVEAAARHIIQTCGVESILATRSQDGMSVITADAPCIHIPTRAREVFDVSGAGDTVVAMMAAALGTGCTLEEAAHIANAAGGVVVGKFGTAVVYPAELARALSDIDNITMQETAPLLSVEEAVTLSEKWKAAGKTVGFTNGCFDLLHPGHIQLLTEAAGQCDKLIVAINADDSPYFKTKGPDRPIHDETSRATVLQALSMVDAVIAFSTDTPMAAITAITPDVLIKGADYTVDTVVGADHVIKSGGRVHLAAIKDGHSTTRTVEKIHKSGGL